jgi:hypothetical protein
MAEAPFFEWVEAKNIELHLGHHTQDQIVPLLKTGKPWLSRCTQEFHRSGIIPNALGIGLPLKGSSELVTFIEACTLEGACASA